MKNAKLFKKIAAALIAAAMLASVLTGCGKKAAKDADVINVAVISGPTGVGMVSLMEADEKGISEYDYEFNKLSGPESTVALLSSGEVDIAAMPTNLAANFAAKGGDITVLAVNTLGVLYIADNGQGITDIASLRGKTVYSTGKGSNPQFILNYILQKNGLDPEKDLEVVYLTENTDLAAKLVSGEAKVALVPEPIASTVCAKNADVKIALNMTEEWSKAGGAGELMMGCVAVRNEFLKNSPNAVASFMSEYKASIEACADVDATAALCAKFEIIAAEGIAKAAIPRCNVTFVTGQELKSKLSGYLQVLYDSNPASIGGQMPDDDFYYKG